MVDSNGHPGKPNVARSADVIMIILQAPRGTLISAGATHKVHDGTCVIHMGYNLLTVRTPDGVR